MSNELQHLLEESQSFIRCKSDEIQALDRELGPFWSLEREIKAAIRQSYRLHGGRIVISLDPAEIELRRGLYVELERLTEVFGPIRTKRREAREDLDATMRQVERLHELMARPQIPQRSKTAQLNLF